VEDEEQANDLSDKFEILLEELKLFAPKELLRAIEEMTMRYRDRHHGLLHGSAVPLDSLFKQKASDRLYAAMRQDLKIADDD